MLSDLLPYIDGLNINKESDNVLIAVSGGADSMVLLDCFRRSDFKIGVAHVNYHLRSNDSDLDQKLVSDYCKLYQIPFFDHQVNREVWHSGNLQSVARNIRYRFFEKICLLHQYTLIATAHHAQDSIETVILNFIKGTGIGGLTGIPVENKNIIRPFLKISKEEVLAYANDFRVVYREDQSNTSIKYARNRIRHQVIPELKEIAPQLEKTILKTTHNLTDTHTLLKYFVEQWKDKYVEENEHSIKIPNIRIAELKGKMTLLHTILSPYGFNRDQILEIIATLGISGKYFSSSRSKLHIERDHIYLEKDIHWQKPESSYSITYQLVDKVALENDPFVEFINGDKLNINTDFTFAERQIKNGDRMQPLGMNGKSKLISDIITDKKLTTRQKNELRILHDGNTPIWLIGIRLDHRFRVTPQTQKIYKITASTNSLSDC